MATYKGKEGAISANDDFVAEVRNFDLTVTSNEVDTSTMGSNWTGVDSTQLSWKGSAEIFWDPDDTGQQNLKVGDKVAIKFYPQGDITGRPLESGSALVTSAARTQAYDNIISQSFEFTGDGALDQTGSVA